MSYIMVSGREVACDAPVILWEQTGLRFDALGRRTETRCVVLHHTGGNGLAPQVFRTLTERRLSVHFCVDPNGNVYQFCDADRRCAHAGSVDDLDGDGVQLSGNACSIGIEVVNPATPTPPARGIQREIVRERIHGSVKPATAFTPEQVASTLALTRSLCAAYGLPMAVPMAGDDVLATVMAERAFKEFRGVVGHLHLTQRKRDPGLAILRAVR